MLGAMARLTPCPSCRAHVFANERSCPHCGSSLRAVAGPGAVVLMGLALAGCPDSSNTPEPEYGVPDTSVTEPEPADSGNVAEPEYGVPDTEHALEPDYGGPETRSTDDG